MMTRSRPRALAVECDWRIVDGTRAGRGVAAGLNTNLFQGERCFCRGVVCE